MLWLSLWAMVAGATISPGLGAAERAYEAGQYDEALALLGPVLEQPLEKAQRVRAYELMALTQAAFNASALAIDAFKHALELDATYDPGAKASPKVRGLFESARRALPPAPAPRPQLLPSVSATAAPNVPLAVPSTSAAPPSPGLLRRWWFWAGVGVVAAGVAGGVVAVSESRWSTSGTLGSGRLQ